VSEPVSSAWNLARVRAVWARRKWLAMAVFFVPLAATAGVVPALPDIYKASAVVLVERQQVPEEFVKSTITNGLETRLNTMSQEILSRARLADLIERFDLYPKLGAEVPLQAVIERMRRDLRVELKGMESLVRGGAIVAFTISYLGATPEKAATVANTLASYYLEENTRVRERQAAGTAQFLRRQLEDMKERLERQERTVKSFKKEHIGESPQDMQANLIVLERLNTQLRLNNENLSRVTERREALSRQMADAESLGTLLADSGLTAAGGGAPAPDPAVVRLNRLNQELGELRSRFSEKYPDVVALKKEIADLERQVAAAKARSEAEAAPAVPKRAEPQVNPLALQLKEGLGEVEAELRTLKGEEKRLRADLALYQRRVENAPKLEQEFLELSRGYETTADLYRTLLKRYEEAQLAETLEQRQKGEQFRVLESAVPPPMPFAPNRNRLFVMGTVASLGLALGAVLLAEQLNSSFHTLDELRAFSPAVVASIPRIVTPGDSRQRRWRIRLVAAMLVVTVVVVWAAAAEVARRNEQVVSILTRDRS
jgi:succinoglycan biosynthesis transport protein ExoP